MTISLPSLTQSRFVPGQAVSIKAQTPSLLSPADTLNLHFGGKASPADIATKKLAELKALCRQLSDLSHAQSILGWDQSTWPLGHSKGLPEKAAGERASQSGTLASLSHQLLTAPKVTRLLSTLSEPGVFSQLSPQDQKLVRIMKKDVSDASKIPLSLVNRMAETTSRASLIWEKARAANDYSQFAPVLKELVSLNREKAKAIGFEGSPYDALLSEYEPGMTTQKLDSLFGDLKGQLTTITQAIQQKPKPKTSFLVRYYSSRKQYNFAKSVLAAIGFDLSRGRLAMSTHPFTSTVGGRNDVGLTIRTRERSLMDSIGAAIHEGGHGIYEQGISPDWDGTPVASGTSLGVHESQSRVFELMVGQSKPFWKHFLPKLKEKFPTQLENVGIEKFYKAINKVEPSLIRVEADEVTYIQHIIIRYEIEKSLIEGKMEVEDIPKAWNQKMHDYLGVTPPDDAQGCLQDVHWSFGGFGYFPTYALGTLGAAQLFNKAKQVIPDLEKKIAKGKLAPFKEWLNENVHKNGRADAPEEIFVRATGEPLNAKYFIDYLWNKYGELYGIERPKS